MIILWHLLLFHNRYLGQCLHRMHKSEHRFIWLKSDLWHFSLVIFAGIRDQVQNQIGNPKILSSFWEILKWKSFDLKLSKIRFVLSIKGRFDRSHPRIPRRYVHKITNFDSNIVYSSEQETKADSENQLVVKTTCLSTMWLIPFASQILNLIFRKVFGILLRENFRNSILRFWPRINLDLDLLFLLIRFSFAYAMWK